MGIMMRYMGDLNDPVSLIHGHVYRMLGEDTNCCAIVDETGEDYLYAKEWFEPADEESRKAFEEYERRIGKATD
ncbi:MAG: hypothetical protein SOI26_03785 [Coriobacteriales bacterium]|jgi:hypothetical protein